MRPTSESILALSRTVMGGGGASPGARGTLRGGGGEWKQSSFD